jgi:hypothetical protein
VLLPSAGVAILLALQTATVYSINHQGRFMIRLIFISLFLVITGCASPAQNVHTYGLEIVSIGDDGETRHIRYNKSTGEAWWASNTKWVKITDEEALPESSYQVRIVSTDTSWRALRLDTKSGKTWKNSKGRWIPFTE